VVLPATTRAAESAEPEARQEVYPSGLQVLIMDDKDEVLHVCSRMLTQLKHSATRAKTAEEAMDLLRDPSLKFDVIVLDMTIPGGRGGAEVAAEVRELHGDSVRVIASTGYTEDAIIANPKGYGFDAVLPKPYTIAELAHAVGQAK
jgi:CheY-like chemotaxis protein